MSFNGNTKGFVDTKQFRKCILSKANDRLGLIVKSLSNGENGTYVPKDRGMLGLLDSSYKSDVPSTNYAMHLKAIAFESGRFLCTTQQVTDDIVFDSTRGEYLSQNIASFLFPGQRFSQTSSTDESVRNFYLSIIEAYFGGSTRQNIENSLLRFLEVPVGIVENFLLAREDATLDSIINKFTFDIVIQVDDPRIKDVNQLQKDIEFLLNIIKPAHTTFTTKFIFSELFDIFGKGCLTVLDTEGNPLITHDGFETKIKQATTAICEVLHFDTHDYFYEDFRKPCAGSNYLKVEDEIIQEVTSDGDVRQASPRWATSVVGGTWDYSDPSVFHTRFGPFGKEDGSIADSVSDIQVYVNGVRSEVTEIYPLSGSFKLWELPPEDALITVTYYYLRKYVGALITNDKDSVINNWKNQATELNYKTVLFPSDYSIEEQIPLEKKYRYKGFNLYNSSVLNDALTLNMNELSLRNRMNDYDVFKSHGYDEDIYATTLVDGQELVPRSLEKQDVWRRLPYQEFRMNNNEFVMNNREDRMYGETHYESYHPFYSVLEYDILDNGGTPNIVNTICEDSKNGMMIDFRRLIELDFTHGGTETAINRDHDCQLFTFPTIPELYSGSRPATYSVINDLDCTLQGGNGSWDLEHPLPAIPEYLMGGNHTTMRMVIDDVKEEVYEGIDELWEVLWNRDPSENTVYSVGALAGTGNSSDRGYLLNTFVQGSVSGQKLPEPVTPIHIDDVSREYYKENTWLIANVGQTNSIADILSGTKLKEADVETCYVKLTDYIPMMMNGYRKEDLYALDPTINSNGVIVASINNNPPSSSPLLFLTPRKILDGRVSSVFNETQGFFYDLSGMDIINDQVIDLDIGLNPLGLNNGDIVRVDYEAVDYTNEYDHLISVHDPSNFVLFSNRRIKDPEDQYLNLNVQDKISGSSAVGEDIYLVDLDEYPTSLLNLPSLIKKNSKIYSAKDSLLEEDWLEIDFKYNLNYILGLFSDMLVPPATTLHSFNQEECKFISENGGHAFGGIWSENDIISLESSVPFPDVGIGTSSVLVSFIHRRNKDVRYLQGTFLDDGFGNARFVLGNNTALDLSNEIITINFKTPTVFKIYNFTKGFEYDLGGSSYLEANKLIHLDTAAGINSTIGLDQGDLIFATYITLDEKENPAPVMTESNNQTVTTAIEVFPV